MKKVYLFLVAMTFSLCSMAQDSSVVNSHMDSLTELDVRNKVLNEIQVGLDKKTKVLDSTVLKLDEKVSLLDKSISDTRDAREKADKLLQRVQAIEDKQKALDQTELNLVQANYQSAVVNLVSMDREIKPLVLFNSTKTFFGALSDAGNPMNYDGYTQWYKGFSSYLQENKSKSPVLSVTNSLLGFASGFTKGVPVTGPITSALFSGMSSYIDNMGKKEKSLKEQSEKMLTLTMKISQFDYDKDQIEHEWDVVAKELKDLQEKYDKALQSNLSILSVNRNDFNTNFSTENDAEKRYQYLTHLRENAAKFVSDEKDKNPKDWKQKAYIQMNEVQNLKLRFGQITLRISQNILKYKDLFAKYRDDAQLGSKIKDLEIKLKEMQESFDSTFDPMDYINSATKMYKV